MKRFSGRHQSNTVYHGLAKASLILLIGKCSVCSVFDMGIPLREHYSE
jgi:hypothetical protein